MKKKDPYFQPIPQILEELKIPGQTYEKGVQSEDIIESLGNLYGYIPLKSETGRKEIMIRKLIDEWFTYKVGSVYEELSSDVLTMKTEVEIDLNKAEIVGDKPYGNKNITAKCEIPVFLRGVLDKHTRWEETYTHREEKEHRSDSIYEFKISSKIPQVPFSIRKDGAKAIAFAYAIYSEAIETEVLGDIILQNPDYAPYPGEASAVVLWKARPEDLQIEVKKEELYKDPVLILNWNKPYLVSTWIEPNEDPFLDLLPFFKNKPKPI